jgi:uncharacterized membrane protein
MPAVVLMVSAAGVIVGLLIVFRCRQFASAIAAALELWMAAGLLRLAVDASWVAIGSAAAIVAIRTIVKIALRSAS